MAYVSFIGLLFCLSFGITLSARSLKKGTCVSVSKENYKCEDMKAFTDVVWWYDWGLAPLYILRTNCTYKPTQPTVAMVWSGGQVADLKTKLPKETKYILGFNEPNHREQANMTAKEAAALWPKIEASAGNRTLVSPSAVGCGSGPPQCISDVIPWFDEFFNVCKNCRIDYLATHHYSCNADKTMEFLRQIYQRYGKKIWLTEFSCPKATSVDKILNYMKTLLPQLEKADFVYRYAWFTSRRVQKGEWVAAETSLLNKNSSTLSVLGQYYNNFKP